MAAPGSLSLRSGISAGLLTLANYYQVGSFNQLALKEAGYQLVSSMMADNLESIVRGFLPSDSQVSSMYLKPILVGGSYSMICYFVDGNKNYMGNFMLSAGSEFASTYVQSSIAGY